MTPPPLRHRGRSSSGRRSQSIISPPLARGLASALLVAWAGAACGAPHEAFPAPVDPRGGIDGTSHTSASPSARPARLASSAPNDRPYVLVLGTAQDGGLPQIGCGGEACEAARTDPSRRRLVASLLLADPRTGARWLVDATPDLREQVELARGHPATRVDEGPRPPLFDGVFLTHAHMGHVTGLLQFGREVSASHDLPVFGSERLVAFLNEAPPYELLARAGHIAPLALQPGVPRPLHAAADGRPDLVVVPLTVPHRDEFSDTSGFVIRGPTSSLLYVPDIDRWANGRETLLTWLAAVDVALLDGTFFSLDEVPGRDLRDVPHPPVSLTLELLADAPAALRAKVVFTHLNHGNPVADPTSAAAAAVRAAGMSVACEGDLFAL